MKRSVQRQLMRLVTGELSAEEEARLRRRLADDPELAARNQELENLWQGLELPPATPAPPGFAASLVARVAGEQEGRSAPLWNATPVWVRAAGALALAGGLALGAGLSAWVEPPAWEETEEEQLSAPSLAEGYWWSLEPEADPMDESEVER
jgi:anti-sigma factor RsiW